MASGCSGYLGSVIAPTRLSGPEIRVSGVRVHASTYLAYAGAYQLTLSTTVAELALELHSSYLGHPACDVAISHLELARATEPAIATELRPAADLLVGDRRRCLYDHLAQLQELLAGRCGAEVKIEVADGALDLVESS